MTQKQVLVGVLGQEAIPVNLEENETVQDALNKAGFEAEGTFSIDGEVVGLEAVPENNALVMAAPSKVVQMR